jgi:hypothetical protein
MMKSGFLCEKVFWAIANNTSSAQQQEIRDMLRNLLSDRRSNMTQEVQQEVQQRAGIPPTERGRATVEAQDDDRTKQEKIMDIVNRVKNIGNGAHKGDINQHLEDLLEELESNVVREDERNQRQDHTHPDSNDPQFEPRFGLDELPSEVHSTETSHDPSNSRNLVIRQALHESDSLLPPSNEDQEATNWVYIKKFADVVGWARKSMLLLKEQNILDSLSFENMDLRRNSISRAHSNTFKWLLKPYDSTSELLKPYESTPELRLSPLHMHSTFIQWLQHSDDTYWIGGKPGSGKSTMMKYILDEKKTAENLKKWSRGENLYIAGYFFWHRGSKIQRSQQGLLQSLLFTVLEATPGLAGEVCESRMTNHKPSWTLSELKTVFTKLGHAQLSNSKFCFFIDGLDEYSGDHFELVELLQTLSDSPRFKLCLASRPWPCFEDAFGKDPNRCLHLQELTKLDIEKYTRESLDQAKDQSLSIGEKELFNKLIDEVVQKSQGVFLWVTLVVRSLREGLANGDSISILKKRVHNFPADLEPFFEALINSVDPTYRSIMAKTFLVTLETSHLPVVALSFLEEEWDYAITLRTEPLMHKEITRIQTKMRRRINGRYKGLIECWKDYDSYGYPSLLVEFLHRTVRDFLKTAPIQKILLSHVDKTFDAELSLCRIHLAQLKTRPIISGLLPPTHALSQLFDLSWRHQLRNNSCDYEALEELGNVLKGRSEISIKNEAEYLGLLARRGLSVYIHTYLKQNPNCAGRSLGYSPIMFLLNREQGDNDIFQQFRGEKSGGEEVDVGADIQDPQEVLKLVNMFTNAGYSLGHDNSDKQCWEFLVEYVMTVGSKVPRFLESILSPLLDLCIARGSTFSDLISEKNGNERARHFARSLNLGRRGSCEVSPLKLLEKLFAQGLNPMERHKNTDNTTLWSLILDEVNALFDGVRQLNSAVDSISLCLRHGADSDEPKFLQLLNRGIFSEAQVQSLRNVVDDRGRQRNNNKRRKRKGSISGDLRGRQASKKGRKRQRR